jgi:opacity protein-like surface antigen
VKKVVAAAFAIGLGSCFVHAADMPMAPPVPIAVWSWTGLYIGGNVGAGFGSAALTDPAGAPIYGNNIRSPAVLGGVQVGYNWQIPNTAFVVGAEADASAMGADGSMTCLASSGYFFSANCRVRPEAIGSLTGRVGFATGPHGRTLFYAKGGLAWMEDRVDITTNGFVPIAGTVTSFEGVRWGWTAGAGIDRALTPAWSFRLEYDFAKFGDLSMATPTSAVQPFPPFFPYFATPGGNASISQNVQTVKVSLNYKIGEDMYARWEPPAADYHLKGAYVPDAEIEVGGRIWYSTGRFQKDLGGFDPTTPNMLVSRLAYESTGTTGEVFGRIDTVSNIFVKGFVGGGTILSGNMHDEDWLFNDGIPYSNTASTVKGDLAYGTFDAGYSVFRGPSANVGGFIGFNYYRENKSAYGCTQIANPFSDCNPAPPASQLGITEDDKWYSFRVGVNGVVTVWDRLKLTTDAAYLPFVAFRGTDNHLQRFDKANTISPETGGGQGVQLEAILSYAFVNGFNVGAGGRYWAMWAPGATTDLFSQGGQPQTLPVRTERYGAFVQASYKLDGLK